MRFFSAASHFLIAARLVQAGVGNAVSDGLGVAELSWVCGEYCIGTCDRCLARLRAFSNPLMVMMKP